MKKTITYHEVKVSFAVSDREAKRALAGSGVKTLKQLVTHGIGSNAMNALDVEDLRVTVNGK